MRGLGLLVCLTVAFAATAQAQTMTLIEDFETYTEDATIHFVGDWPANGGTMTGPGWQAQRNSDALGDHTWSTVVDMGGRNVLQLINRDTGGELDTVYTSMHMGIDNYINSTGTVYVRFMAKQDGDTLIAINDYYPGWDYDGLETGDAGAPSFQGTATGGGCGYANNAALVELSAEPWRAFNTSGYEQGLAGQPTKVADQWYEMWMQVDFSAKAVRYYLCEDGGAPTVVPTATGGQWWGFRNTAATSVDNLKFFAGRHGTDPDFIETQTYIDSIAVNTTEYSTERYDGWVEFPEITTLRADFDGDGDVDLDDFVILKKNFNVVPPANGDADGDGDVDLDDFVILKKEFAS